MLTLLSLCSLLVAATELPAPRRVAVVYSAFGDNAFREEWSPALGELGWAFDLYENTRFPELIGRLADYDIVLGASVCNLNNTVDMEPYAAAWRDWLSAGNLLIIADASYGSVLDSWLGRLGPEFALGVRTLPAAASRVGAPASHAPTLSVPEDLAGPLNDRGTVWTELVPGADSRWETVHCLAEGGGPLLVEQAVGTGTVVATAHYRFGGNPRVTGARPLLANYWHHTLATRAGLRLAQCDLGAAQPGQHEAVLELANPTATAVRYDVTLALGAADLARGELVLAGGERGTLRLPYTFDQRGDLDFALRVQAGDAPPFTYPQARHVAEQLTFDLLNAHLYPWQVRTASRATKLLDNRQPADGVVLEARVDDGAWRPLAEGAGEVVVPAAAPGQHAVEARLRAGETVLTTVTRPLWRHPQPRVYARPGDLTTMVDGQPFFPLGLYHVSWGFDADDRLDTLRQAAAMGFNTLHAGIRELDEWQPLLGEAQRLGMMVITEFGQPMDQVITRYRNHPAVLAWNPGDEPDGSGTSPAEMLERHNLIKSLDPSVPTYMVLCVPPTYARYAAMAEVIAPDIYPVRHASADVLPVFTDLRAAVDIATPLGRPIWAVPQAFGYTDPTSWRVPTAAETRAMTWLSLLAGAKGLIYYTFHDQGFDLRDQPALKAALTDLAGEVRGAGDWLLNGRRVDVDTPHAAVRAGVWRAAGQTLVALVNASSTETYQVDLPLAGAPRGALDALPGAPAPRLRLQDGRLVGSLPPLAVEVALLPAGG